MNACRDTLWRGQIVLWQPSRGQGYRVNLDPLLLAAFATPARHVLDLGAGVGVVGLLLLASDKAERVTAVEIQPWLAALARDNVRDNGLTGRMSVIEGDLRGLALPAVDAVVFNPPYHPAAGGRGAPHRGRDAARHERHGTLRDFVVCARAAASAGPVAAIVPAVRGPELAVLFHEAGLSALRRREVTPRQGARPGRWLLEARSGAAALENEPPLAVHGAHGREFSPEVRLLLRED